METRERVDLLGKVPLFFGLMAGALERIASLCGEETFARDDVIFRHGDAGDRLYVIASGSVRIGRDVPGLGEEALAVLATGAVFGEMSLLGEATRSADARAHGRCRLLSIDNAALMDLLFLQKEVAYEVLWNMARLLSARLRETNDKLALLTFSSKF